MGATVGKELEVTTALAVVDIVEDDVASEVEDAAGEVKEGTSVASDVGASVREGAVVTRLLGTDASVVVDVA